MATEATEAANGAAESSAGMPQLDFSTFPNQIFWLVITLVVIYLVLSRVALPRIAEVLAARQGAITSDIATAEELKRKAANAEEAYERALAEARAEAGRIAAEAKAEMQAEVDAAIERADTEIASKAAESAVRIDEIRKGAAEAVRDVARSAASDVVAALDVQADRAAIDAAVAAQMNG